MSLEVEGIQEYDIKTGSKVPVISKEDLGEWITSRCVPV